MVIEAIPLWFSSTSQYAVVEELKQEKVVPMPRRVKTQDYDIYIFQLLAIYTSYHTCIVDIVIGLTSTGAYEY